MARKSHTPQVLIESIWTQATDFLSGREVIGDHNDFGLTGFDHRRVGTLPTLR